MPRLALSLLGTFQASAGEQPITNFATDKVRALLAYLAVEADRPHRRDTLAALLWPDWNDSGARSNLRLALHRLREALDTVEPTLSANLFGITRETVQIHGAAADVDVARFIALLETCELHPHRLLHLCPSCLKQLSEAAALYNGELLAGLSIDDAPGFEQWELYRREELGRSVLALLYRLADAFEQLGDNGRGLLFAHRQLALDPYREEAHRQVIRFYALQGERAAALAHFERVRRLLIDEVGVEPDAATVELMEQVRTGKLIGGNHTGRPLLHHFPARFTPFFGRAVEIDRLVERLAAPGARLITVVAPGGMGKTRLAIAVAEVLAERSGYPDGIYFLSLARVASADLLPSTLAAALNINLGGAADPADQLAGFLRPMRALLVLDNFEHLLAGVDLLLRLMEQAPGLQMLITSREALNVRGEERFVLGGLDDKAGEVLFAGAAARVRSGYDPNPDDREAIRAIVRDVGGMPLAVELAATWVRLMDAPAIAAQIRADLDFLSTNLRDLPERQRSMRTVFDYMWATLSPPEQRALAALSVLRGPFRFDAAEAIAGASPGVLALLFDQSLLRSADGGRFELHELLRQYAAGKATPAERAAAEERHAAHYLALMEERGAALGGAQSKEALAALLRNLDNIRAAWGWTVAHGLLEDMARVAPALKFTYRFSGLLVEGVGAFGAAVTVLESRIRDGQIAPDEGYPLVYGLLADEAMLLDMAGRMPVALQRLEAARAGWESIGDRKRLCRVLSDIGQVHIRSANFKEAHRAVDAALTLAIDIGDDALKAHALHNKGSAMAWSGDPAGALVIMEESVAYFRAIDDQKELVGALCDMGTVNAFKHDFEIAHLLLTQSLSIADTIGDYLGVLMARTNLGALFLELNDLASAEQYSLEALALAQDLGEQQLLSVAMGNLGHRALIGGNRPVALRYYINTLGMTVASGLDYMLSEALMGLAVMAADSKPVPATRWLAAVEGWRMKSGYGAELSFITRLTTEAQDKLRATLGVSDYEDRRAESLTVALEAAAGEAQAWATGEGFSL